MATIHWVEFFTSMKFHGTEWLCGLENVTRASDNVGFSSKWVKFYFLGELSL